MRAYQPILRSLLSILRTNSCPNRICGVYTSSYTRPLKETSTWWRRRVRILSSLNLGLGCSVPFIVFVEEDFNDYMDRSPRLGKKCTKHHFKSTKHWEEKGRETESQRSIQTFGTRNSYLQSSTLPCGLRIHNSRSVSSLSSASPISPHSDMQLEFLLKHMN